MTLVQPTMEMQQHIRTELNEDVSTRDKDLEHIKEWLRLQPHLPQFQGKWILWYYVPNIYRLKIVFQRKRQLEKLRGNTIEI